MLCSVIPDLDAIGFHFGIHYGDFWGHRGFTHSLIFAALLAGVVGLAISRRGAAGIGRFALFMYLFLATASHGVLDAMTDGGLGVAFFSPFDNRRYFLPWRPIHVSPIAMSRFFTPRGFAILQNEAVWIWVPAILLAGIALALRRVTKRIRRPRELTSPNLNKQTTQLLKPSIPAILVHAICLNAG